MGKEGQPDSAGRYPLGRESETYFTLFDQHSITIRPYLHQFKMFPTFWHADIRYKLNLALGSMRIQVMHVGF